MLSTVRRELPPAARLPLLLLGMLALLGGTLTGLARLAVEVPALAASRAGGHGALMVAAFFGTVISLERAVALRRLWSYLAPLAAGLGGLALLAGTAGWLAPALGVVAGMVLCLGSGIVLRQQPALFTATLAAGAVCWTLGNLLWLGGAGIAAAVPCWMAFLVLTIAGERLELTRLLPPRPAARQLFIVVLLLVGAGLALAVAGGDSRLFGFGLFALAIWLLRHDIARRTVRQSGLTRFVAVCLLAGYAWLAVGGLLASAGGFDPGHRWRDAALHAVFLGFVFSMVIGHAPIIFPAVMRVRIPWQSGFYLPLAALHLSLLVRVTGDLADRVSLRQGGGIANGLALLLFVLTLLASVWRGNRGTESTKEAGA